MTARISKFIVLFLSLCICQGFADSRQQAANDIERNRNPKMEPKLVIREEIKLIGIAVRTTNKQEMDPATAKISGLYGRFFQEQIADNIPNKTPLAATVAVYTKYESDHSGAYDLIVGRAVNSLGSIPEGMTGVTIPAGRYLLFNANGPMPKALIDTWEHILTWFPPTYSPKSSKLQRAYTTDYEVQTGNDRAEIYIAVK
jgi:predicted transcriptional regulator YdeE